MNGKNKKKRVKVCVAKLRDDFILLKIENFHTYVGHLANEVAKCSQTGTSKRRGGIKSVSVKTLTSPAKPLPVS